MKIYVIIGGNSLRYLTPQEIEMGKERHVHLKNNTTPIISLDENVLQQLGEARTKELIKVRCNKGISEIIDDCKYHFSDIVTKSNWKTNNMK